MINLVKSLTRSTLTICRKFEITMSTSSASVAEKSLKLRDKPFIVICGCTGTGKTKLSIEIAQWLIGQGKQCEIINADAMQLYKNLDIITNKATESEMKNIKHHLIGFLEPTETSFTVINYRNKAVALIDDLLENNKIPILVGGTNYYIQSIIWDILIDKATNEEEEDNEIEQPKNKKRKLMTDELILPEIKEFIEKDTSDSLADDLNRQLEDSKLSNQTLYDQLKRVDEKMALKLHPNDRRKICTSIQIYMRHGINKSTLLELKKEAPSSSDIESIESDKMWVGSLRYKNPCIFVMTCENKTLDKRLDDRVAQMVANGLIAELQGFRKVFENEKITQTFREYSKNYTLGIFQSIGFKEFEQYLDNKEEKLFEDGLLQMKFTTKRYARIQMRWIKNRYVKKISSQTPPIFELNTTDLTKWREDIFDKAQSRFQAYMSNYESDVPIEFRSNLIHLTLSPNEAANQGDKFASKRCDICNIVLTTESQWTSHVSGNKHKRRRDSLNKQHRRLSKQLDQLAELKMKQNVNK